MRFITIVIAFNLSLLLSGCGTTQQKVHFPEQGKYVEEEGKGRIYIIGSPFSFNLVSRSTTVSVVADDKHIGYIAGHRYLCWEREPGLSTIAAYVYKSKSVVSLNIESGKVYYILAHVGPDLGTINPLVPGSGEMAVVLEAVNEEKGKEALFETKPPELK